jgi:predicted outer membrane lipoprotein
MLAFLGCLIGALENACIFGMINALMGELMTIVTDLGTLYSDAASAVGL